MFILLVIFFEGKEWDNLFFVQGKVVIGKKGKYLVGLLMDKINKILICSLRYGKLKAKSRIHILFDKERSIFHEER